MLAISDNRKTERHYAANSALQERLLASGEFLRITNDVFSPAVIDGLQPARLKALANGDFPALHMKNAVNHAWCDQVSERFAQHPATQREGVSPPIYSLGSHLYSCAKHDAFPCYFKDIEQKNAAIADVLPGGHDPIVSFLKTSCELHNAKFEYLSYAGASARHGALRLWGGGSQTDANMLADEQCYFAMPHEDYEETNANHPELHQIYNSNNVYSIIWCIDAIEDREPETIVWDRRITLDEVNDPVTHHPWASYGFSEALLEGVDAMIFRLRKGDAAIIPAHHLHAVIGYPGFRRCTYMAFFHFIKNPAGGFSKIIFRT